MSASSGQRSRARVLRRWCSEDFVESGIVATGLILSNAVRVGVVRRVGLATTRGGWTKVVMGVSCALVIVLCRIDHAVLTARARAGRSEHLDVVRARIVLAAAGAPATRRSLPRWGFTSTRYVSGEDGSPLPAWPRWWTCPG